MNTFTKSNICLMCLLFSLKNINMYTFKTDGDDEVLIGQAIPLISFIIILHICHGYHGGARVNLFWPV